MAAVISGEGLGLYGSSLNTLGNRGPANDPVLGRYGNQVYVNAVTGNLVVRQRDEYVASMGVDLALARTYNSLGQIDGDNNDNWRLGIYRSLSFNPGGSITKTYGDGSQAEFLFDASSGDYISTTGDGAHDVIRADGANWVWRSDDGEVIETYDGSGRLQSLQDRDGHVKNISYTGNLITQISDTDGQVVTLNYNGNNLESITTTVGDPQAGGYAQTRVHYTYDASNRLETVTVDLTPGDTLDDQTFVTVYTYDGTSNRIATINYSGGAPDLAIEYYTAAETPQPEGAVKSITDGAGNVTQYSYATNVTTVTDPLLRQTNYYYDSNNEGRLTKVESPALTDGGPRLVTEYGYDADGNVTSVQDPTGAIVSFEYDARGNLTRQTDAAGNVVEYSYTADNLLNSETVYLQADPDYSAIGSVQDGPLQAAEPQTTYYVYDAEDHLRFVISPEGRVTEHRYAANGGFDDGQRIATLGYTADTYAIAPLQPAPTEADLFGWLSTVDLSAVERTDYAYDFRGQLSSSTRYDAVGIDGSVTASPKSVTHFIYDQAGQLRKTVSPRSNGQGPAETADIAPDQIQHDINNYETLYVYDGLGRLITQTDAAGNITHTDYDDANNRIKTTYANGLMITDVYDNTGRLISSTESDSTQSSIFSTRYNLYDTAGQLRVRIDANGASTYYFYDGAGRQVASIDPEGLLTEIVYDGAGRVQQTLRYATPVSQALLDQLAVDPTLLDEIAALSDLPTTKKATGTFTATADNVSNTQTATFITDTTSETADLTVSSVYETVQTPYQSTNIDNVAWIMDNGSLVQAPGFSLKPGTALFNDDTPTEVKATIHRSDGTVYDTVYTLVGSTRTENIILNTGTPQQPYGYQASATTDTVSTANQNVTMTVNSTQQYLTYTQTSNVANYGWTYSPSAQTIVSSGSGYSLVAGSASRVDNTPVTVQAKVYKSNGAYVQTVTLVPGHTTSYTVSSAYGGTPITYYLWHTATNWNGHVNLGSLGPGTYYAVITTTDTATLSDTSSPPGKDADGTWTRTNTVNFTIGGQIPDHIDTRLSWPNSITPSGTTSITFRYKAPGSSAWVSKSVGLTGSTRYVDFDHATNGTYTYEITYKDTYGNVLKSTTDTFVVNGTADSSPVATFQYPSYSSSATSGASIPGFTMTAAEVSKIDYLEAKVYQAGTTTQVGSTALTYAAAHADYFADSQYYVNLRTGSTLPDGQYDVKITKHFKDGTSSTVTQYMEVGLQPEPSNQNKFWDAVGNWNGQVNLSLDTEPLPDDTYQVDIAVRDDAPIRGSYNGTELGSTTAPGADYDGTWQQLTTVSATFDTIITPSNYDTTLEWSSDLQPEGTSVEFAYRPAGSTERYITVPVTGNLGTYQVTLDQLAIGDYEYRIRYFTNSDDRITYRHYDDAGRLKYTIDEDWYVTENLYDGAGRLIETIQYADKLDDSDLLTDVQALAAYLSGANGVDDRVTRNFYDNDSNLVGELDAEGYFTEYGYNAANRLIHTVRYAAAVEGVDNAATALLRSDGSFQDIKAAVLAAGSDPDDRHTYDFYNGKGQHIANLDAEGYLAEYAYDKAGNLVQEVNYYITANSYSGVETPTQLRPGPHANDRVVINEYNSLNQLVKVTERAGLAVTTVTEYEYDEVGNLVRTTSAAGTVEVRTTRAQYDLRGNVVAELDANGAEVLDNLVNPTQQDIDNVWQQYAVHHVYDAAGRRVSSADQAGGVSYFYYDDDSRVVFTVTLVEQSQAEVTETVYNVFGEVIDTILYTNRIDITGLQGGDVTPQLLALVQQARNFDKDGQTRYEYDKRGNISLKTDAEGYTTGYEYNAYDEIVEETRLTERSQLVRHDLTVDETQHPLLLTPQRYDLDATVDRHDLALTPQTATLDLQPETHALQLSPSTRNLQLSPQVYDLDISPTTHDVQVSGVTYGLQGNELSYVPPEWSGISDEFDYTNSVSSALPDYQDNNSIEIKSDSQGNSIAVWSVGDRILSARRTSNGVWHPVQQVGTLGGGRLQYDMDNQGNAMIVWYNAGNINYATSSAGSNVWSSATAGALYVPHIDSLKVASSGNGDFFIFWTDYDGAYVRSYSGSLGSIQTLDNSEPETGSVNISSRNGHIIVGWRSFGVLKAAVYSSSTWNISNISANMDDSYYNSFENSDIYDVAVDSLGKARILWLEGNGSGSGQTIYSRSFTTSTGWSSSQVVFSATQDMAYSGVGVSVDDLGNGFASFSAFATGSGRKPYFIRLAQGVWNQNIETGNVEYLNQAAQKHKIKFDIDGNAYSTKDLYRFYSIVENEWFHANVPSDPVTNYARQYSTLVVLPSGEVINLISTLEKATQSTPDWQSYLIQSRTLIESSAEYVVAQGESWPDIAIKLYGNDNVAPELAAHYNNITLTAGATLVDPPASLTAQPYYTVQPGDDWEDVAIAVYGTPYVEQQLRAGLESTYPSLYASLEMTGFPASLTAPAGYTVAIGDSWPQIALATYGSTEVADELRIALGDPALVENLRLTGFPPTLTVQPYYIVQSGDSWEDVALAVYGFAGLADELQLYFAPQNLVTGLRLTGFPGTMDDVPSYVVQAGDTWEDIAEALYGVTYVADQLQDVLGNPAYQVGDRLTGFPGEIVAPPGYTVMAGDTWESIAQNLYASADFAALLQQALSTPALDPGVRLTGMPELLELAPTYTVVQNDTWETIAQQLYGSEAVASTLALQYGSLSLDPGVVLTGLPQTLTALSYTIQNGDTWASIAASLYGSADVADNLRIALGDPALAAGNVLANFPAYLWLQPRYVVTAGDTWASISLALYGTDLVASALQAANPGAGTPPSVGTVLTGLPATLVAPPVYTIQSGDSWESIALNLYGTSDVAGDLEAALNSQQLLPSTRLMNLPGYLNTSVSAWETTRHVYDKRGLLKETTEDVGGIERLTSIEYDAFGRIVSRIDANNTVTQYDYIGNDGTGRQVVMTSGLGSQNQTVSTVSYDAFDRVLRQIDANNNVTQYQYSDADYSVTITTPEGISTTTARNRHGEVVSVVDGENNVSQYSYDRNGNLISVVTATGTPDESVETREFDRANRLIKTTDANGNITSFEYDAVGRTITRTVDPSDPANGYAGLDLTTTYQYDGQGRIVSSTDQHQVTTVTEYDRKGNVTAVTIDPYDAVDNPQGLNLRTEYAYNGRNQVLTVTEGANGLGARTSEYRYDRLGRRTSQIVDPGGLNIRTDYEYNDNDNLIARTEAAGTAQARTTRYVYDELNRLIFTINDRGEISKNVYDDNGNIVQTLHYGLAHDISSAPTVAEINQKLDLNFSVNISSAQGTVQVDPDQPYQYIQGVEAYQRSATSENAQVQIAVNNLPPASSSPEVVNNAWAVELDQYENPYIVAVPGISLVLGSSRFPDNTPLEVTASVYASDGTYLGSETLEPGTLNPAPFHGYEWQPVLNWNGRFNLLVGEGSLPTDTYRIHIYANDYADPDTYWVEDDDPQWTYNEDLYVDIIGPDYQPPADVTLSWLASTQPAGTTVEARYHRAGSAEDWTGVNAALNGSQYSALFSALERGDYVYEINYRDADGDVIKTVTGEFTSGDNTGSINSSTVYNYSAASPSGSAIANYVTGGEIDDIDYIEAIVRVGNPLAPNTHQGAIVSQAYTYPGTDADYDGYVNLTGSNTLSDGAYDVTIRKHLRDGHIIEGRLYYEVGPQARQGLITEFRWPADKKPPVGTSARLAYNMVGSPDNRYVDSVQAVDDEYVVRLEDLAQGDYEFSIEYVDDVTGVIVASTSGIFTVTNGVSANIATDFDVQIIEQRSSRTVYDGNNRAIFSIDSENYLSRFEYDNNGNVVATQKFANPLILTFAQRQLVDNDPTAARDLVLGLLAGIEDPQKDQVIRTVFDAAGRTRYNIDALGNVTEYNYYPNGTVERSVAYHEPINLQGLGLKLSEADVLSALQVRPGVSGEDHVTVTVNDRAGRVLERTLAAGTTAEATERYRYDDAGNRVYVIDPRGVELAETNTAWAQAERQRLGYPADYAGLTALQVQQLLDRYTAVEQFDEAGRKVSHTDALGNVTITDYDALGNIVRAVDPNGNEGYFYYDSLGRKILSIDPGGYAVKTAYDALGNVTEETRYAGKVLLPYGLGSDPGQLVYQSLGLDQVTRNEYDSLGRRLKSTDAEGYSETWTYDAFGNQVSHTDKNGNTFLYEYDSNGNLTAERFPVQSVDSSNWINDVLVDTGTEPVWFRKEVAGQDGEIYVLVGQGSQISLLEYSEGGGWLPVEDGVWNAGDVYPQYTQLIASPNLYAVDFAMDSHGNGFLVWKEEAPGLPVENQENLNRRNIFVNRFVAGKGWFGPELLQTVNDQLGLNIHVDSDEQGNTVVSWSDKLWGEFGVSQTVIAGRIYNVDSGWSESENLSSSGSSQYYKLASGPNGEFLFLGKQFSGLQFGQTMYNVVVNRYVPGQGWQGEEVIVDQPVYLRSTENWEQYFSVSYENGNPAVTYRDGNTVIISRFDPYIGWYTESHVLTSGIIGDNQLSFAEHGNRRLAVWNESNDGSFFYALYDEETGWGSSQRLYFNVLDYDFAYSEETGTAVVTYFDNGDLYAARFSFDSGWQDPELLLQTGDPQAQYNVPLDASVDRYGNILVTATLAGGIQTYRLATDAIVQGRVSNVYRYDAFGNRIGSIEASGQAEERETVFVYDARNRLIRTEFDEVEVYDPDTGLRSLITPVTSREYDAFGNVIVETDANGNRTTHYYDAANRRIATVRPDGSYYALSYDAVGNIIATRSFSELLESAADPTVLPATPAGDSMELFYRYDANNREVESSTSSSTFYSYETGVITAAAVNVKQYDGNGSLIKITDGNGNAAYNYYDSRGNHVATVDPEGYLTVFEHDHNGNVIEKVEYANSLSITFDETSSVAALVANVQDLTAGSRDRITRYRYDRMNRQVEKRIADVTYYVANSLNVTAAIGDSVTRYRYNADGKLASITYPDGIGAVEYSYDALGRNGRVMNTAFSDYTGAGTRQIIEYRLDNLGRVVAEVQKGKNSAEDRVTQYFYGADDRVLYRIDARGNRTDYGYDLNGNLVLEEASRTNADGVADVVSTRYEYDAMDRVVSRIEGTGNSYETEYNGLGQITARGLNGGDQEFYEYDAVGNLFRTNSEKGVTHVYLYDRSGNLTLDLNGISQNFADLTVSQILSLAQDQAQTTVYVYDADNRVTDTYKPPLAFADPNQTVGDKLQSGNLNNGNSFRVGAEYNAFGERTADIDARGYRTDYEYNKLGNQTRKLAPTTTIVNQNGVAAAGRPVTESFYDLAGREVGVLDANLNLSTKIYNGVYLSRENHADGGYTEYQYDAFGDLRFKVDLVSVSGSLETKKTTSYSYDKSGNLVSTNANGSQQYEYDEAGNRIAHTNGLGYRERFYYDGEDRLVGHRSFGNIVTLYDYAYDPTTQGIQKTTTFADGRYLIDRYDYFERLISHQSTLEYTDNYSYNEAGWKVHVNGAFGDVFEYYNNGLVQSVMTGGFAVPVSNYEYDENGNRTRETSSYNWLGTSHLVQDVSAVYDELNRLESVTGAVSPFTIEYGYDAVGNIRYIDSVSSQGPNQTWWYKYDQENRVVINRGDLVGGNIVRSAGQAVTYDFLGQRNTVDYGDHVERYTYTDGGILKDIYVDNALRVERTIDAGGRVTSETVHNPDYSGPQSIAITSFHIYEYDNDNRVLVDRVQEDIVHQAVTNQMLWTKKYDIHYLGYDVYGNYARSEVLSYDFDYPTAAPELTQSTDIQYTYWDSSLRDIITTNVYDENGNIVLTGESDLDYNRGNLFSFYDDDPNKRVYYQYNHAGQIIVKSANENYSPAGTQYYLYMNGRTVGEYGNNGTNFLSYAEYLAGDTVENQSDHFKAYDSFQPIIPGNPSATSGHYIVRNGDTLQTIAYQVWGDTSYWYLIADANGLTQDQALTEGMVLTIPNVVSNIHNSSNAFKPYNAGEVIGSTAPTIPAPATPDSDKSAFLKMIIVIVVTVIVAIYATEYLEETLKWWQWAASAVGTGIGSAAGQVLSVELGLQEEVDWGRVAVSAVSAGLTSAITGLDKIAEIENDAFRGFVNGFIGDALSQQLAMEAELEGAEAFSWTQLLGAGISGGVTSRMAAEGADQFATRFTGSVVNEVSQGVLTINRDEPYRVSWANLAASAIAGSLLDHRSTAGNNAGSSAGSSLRRSNGKDTGGTAITAPASGNERNGDPGRFATEAEEKERVSHQNGASGAGGGILNLVELQQRDGGISASDEWQGSIVDNGSVYFAILRGLAGESDPLFTEMDAFQAESDAWMADFDSRFSSVDAYFDGMDLGMPVYSHDEPSFWSKAGSFANLLVNAAVQPLALTLDLAQIAGVVAYNESVGRFTGDRMDIYPLSNAGIMAQNGASHNEIQREALSYDALNLIGLGVQDASYGIYNRDLNWALYGASEVMSGGMGFGFAATSGSALSSSITSKVDEGSQWLAGVLRRSSRSGRLSGNSNINLSGLVDAEAGLTSQPSFRLLNDGRMITVSGVADKVFEIPQALRVGEHLGAGNFAFRQGSSVGIDGDFMLVGSNSAIPVSLKSLDSASSVKNIFRTIRSNAKQISLFGAAEPGSAVLFGRPFQFTTKDITSFISNSKANVLPPSNVFKQTILDARDGTVFIDSAGKVTVREFR